MEYDMKKAKKVNKKVVDIDRRDDLKKLTELSQDAHNKLKELMSMVASQEHDPQVEKFVSRHLNDVRHTIARSINLISAVRRCK
tara:strand:- start:493 stop:744 length:252 start_codon:yes stop_codon:yes gene_type:complete